MLFSLPINSRRACAQSASVNSSGLRSSINAISLARLSTSSGDGAPIPWPCSEIFPGGGFASSFITSSEKQNCIFAVHFGLQIEPLQYNYGKEAADRCIGKMSFNFVTVRSLHSKNTAIRLGLR